MRLLKLVLLTIALLSLVSVANATKSSAGTGSFTSSSSIVHMRNAGENIVLDTKFTLTLTGIFTGKCVGTSHSVMLPDGHATAHGVCTFTGSMRGGESGGPSGTAVLRFQAIGEGASFQGHDVIEQGTAGLAGIHATGTFQGMTTGATSEGTYSANVHFHPS